MIAERERADLPHAFERLRGYARNHNRRLVDVASDVVGGTVDISKTR